ncbi:MAG: DNA polymerase subunit beta, partial [bacterium (Candidatus Ratteibacteria) CG01_land_8_20_14_3_00_40_19]
MNLTGLLLHQKREEEKYFRNYLLYAKKAAIVAKESLPDVKLYLFGSILRKEATPA